MSAISKLSRLAGVLSLAIVASCEVDLRIPEMDSNDKVSVQCILGLDDEQFLSIERATALRDTFFKKSVTPIYKIPTLKANGEKIEIAAVDAAGGSLDKNARRYRFQHEFKEGDVVTVSVDGGDNLDACSSTVTFPARVAAEDVSFSMDSLKVKATLRNPSSEPRYYGLSVKAEDRTSYIYSVSSPEEGYVLASFEDGEVSVRNQVLIAEVPAGESVDFAFSRTSLSAQPSLVVYNVSAPLYSYAKALYLLTEDSLDYLGLIPAYAASSNVVGGLGVFGAVSRREFTLL